MHTAGMHAESMYTADMPAVGLRKVISAGFNCRCRKLLTKLIPYHTHFPQQWLALDSCHAGLCRVVDASSPALRCWTIEPDIFLRVG